MSIYTYLKEDHQQVKQLMNDIVAQGAEDSTKRDELFNELKEKLILHSKAEEQAFYQPLKAHQQTEDDVEHGEEEHEEAEALLEKLTQDNLKGADWQQTFLKLKSAVEHHIEEEENEIFADAKKVIDDKTAEEMEARMKMLKQEERANSIEKRDVA